MFFITKVLIDAYGGDNAPAAAVEGGLRAAALYGAFPIFLGDKDEISKYIGNTKVEYSIIHTEDNVAGDDDPTAAVKNKRESSMMKGLSMLSLGEAQCFVSAGNTGALVSGSTLIVKRIKNVRRVALAMLLPGKPNPTLLLDVGANVDCTPDLLLQFAIMGGCYMGSMYDIEPKVGLLNIGTEEMKGNALTLSAYRQLSSHKGINFVGNVEARDIPNNPCDVLVTDGFTGNMVLKTLEGMGLFFSDSLKNAIYKNIGNKFAGLILQGDLAAIRRAFDYTEYGGAPILGANGVIFKAHGSSNATAWCNAVKNAVFFHSTGVLDKIRESLPNTGSRDNDRDGRHPTRDGRDNREPRERDDSREVRDGDGRDHRNREPREGQGQNRGRRRYYRDRKPPSKHDKPAGDAQSQ